MADALNGLVFGWRTAVLSVAAAVILPIALGLWTALVQRTANRCLALLLLVMVGTFTPWLIGFAGFYDRWPGLTFLPVANPLWGPPLLWLYIRALTEGRLARADMAHLLPGAVQFLWQGVGFLLPLAVKLRWAELSSAAANWVFSLALIASLTGYGVASWRLLIRYRAALALARSDDSRFDARWLSQALTAGGVLAVVWTVYMLWDLLSPLGYKGLMGLYAALAAIAVYLAVEGWRQAGIHFPTLDELAPDPSSGVEAVAADRDWRAQGEVWLETIRAQGWHREPDLTLQRAARRLGTNTAYLSRAFNHGLGQNFSRAINALRCESVAERIATAPPGAILDLALEAGFSSKASFNRAFQERFGMTPRAMQRGFARPGT